MGALMNQQNEFAEFVLSVAGSPAPTDAPQVVYDSDGDCIEFLVTDEDFYAERVDSHVTVYYGRESAEIIGCLFKGVHATLKALSEKLPGFRLEIVDGRIKLSMLFSAHLWMSEPDDQNAPLVITYRKLREVAERNQAEAELLVA
jgi:hypothetical protein